MKANAAYAELERRFARLADIEGAAAMLRWDWAAMMPVGGAEARAEQLATLDVLAHEIVADHGLGELIAEAEAAAGALEPWQRANVREMRRRHLHAAALSPALVAALARATGRCEMAWRKARAENDFGRFAQALAPLLALVREQAQAKGESLGCAPYDALIDANEPGTRSREIDRLFADLAAFLPGVIERVLARQAAEPAPVVPQGPFPVAAQRTLAERLMAPLGFDFAHGRLDVSHHPFCGGVPDDVRITTRYTENDFAPALMATLHETGHALYEQGLPKDWRRQPVGQPRAMSIHESQSLLIEMQLARSLPFVRYMAPQARDLVGAAGDGAAFAPDNLYRYFTRVHPSLIRVDADEVTYPAHVMLRYRLEKAMIEGSLAVADLPAAWGQGMGELLGVVPETDSEGCLQDIHWAAGEFGYFPSYTLGALGAAQIFAAARAALPGLDEAVGEGRFVELLAWLRANIHAQGSRLETRELITRATGRALATDAFKAHIEARYLDRA